MYWVNGHGFRPQTGDTKPDPDLFMDPIGIFDLKCDCLGGMHQ
jgi:hypothetical protein